MSKSAKRTTLQKLIRTGDDIGFKSFMHSHCESGGDDHVILSHYQLWKSICTHGAVNCAHALYDRHDPLEGGLSPLHIAAQCHSCDIIQLLLYFKAKPNSSCDNDPLNVPLCSALKGLCDHKFVSEWNPKKSIFKLFYIFCLPELNEPLETVRLLASKTINLEAIALRFVLQGNIVHLAALLFVAWSKLMEPYTLRGNKRFCNWEINFQLSGMCFRFWILLLIQLRHSVSLVCLRTCSDMKYHLKLHLIHFDPDDLLCDDMSCFAPDASLTPKQKAWLNRALDKEIRSFKTPNTSIKTVAGTISSARSFHTCLARNSYYDKPSRSHQLNTYQARDSKYAELGRSHPLSTCQAQNTNYVETARTQLSRTTHASLRFLPKFLQSQDMATLVAILKRSIRKM